jgi:hypothetical protein
MNIPLGEMVRSIAMAIADAQFQFDRSSIMTAEFMTGSHVLRDPDTGTPIPGPDGTVPHIVDSSVSFGHRYDPNTQTVIEEKVSMMALGFVPNFYQFVDTLIEVKLALRVNRSTRSRERSFITATPVDAAYSSSYNYSADMACVFKTKLVPIPPPAAFEDRIRQLLDNNQIQQENVAATTDGTSSNTAMATEGPAPATTDGGNMV